MSSLILYSFENFVFTSLEGLGPEGLPWPEHGKAKRKFLGVSGNANLSR